ncbi:MAG: aminopeptidase P N-terminal domain-containing protein [Roseimicrobium sp.]
MRVRTLPASLFQAARKRLIKELPPGALVILHANDIYPTNADGVMPFHQSSDLFYLSGVDQEETVLVLFPDAPEEKHREMLFLRETNEHIAIWEGDKLSKEQAEARTGIKKESIYWLDKFEGLFRTLMCRAQHVFLNANEHARATTEVETRELRFIRRCQRDFPLHRYERLAPLLQELRVIKTSEETALIRDAIEITSAAFHRVLEFVRPGVMEFEIEAEIIHEFTRRRATHAFPPILGTGRNACVLHYITNHSECHDGELLLMDFGARSLGYHADLTRTVPVNGKFTKRQREIYDAVLRVQRAARKMLKPGVLLKPYQDDVGLLMQEELLRLKLITKKEIKESLESNPDKPAYKKYFPHGTSHHLGLDVHDVGDTWRKLEPGMVLTIEPGLYIREENIGVRLENDVLITKKGTEDLMDDIPIEPDAIEHLMARK